MKEISEKLLEFLVCPHCKKSLIYNEDKQELSCQNSKLIYKIKNNIPIMLIDEAKNF